MEERDADSSITNLRERLQRQQELSAELTMNNSTPIQVLLTQCDDRGPYRINAPRICLQTVFSLLTKKTPTQEQSQRPISPLSESSDSELEVENDETRGYSRFEVLKGHSDHKSTLNTKDRPSTSICFEVHSNLTSGLDRCLCGDDQQPSTSREFRTIPAPKATCSGLSSGLQPVDLRKFREDDINENNGNTVSRTGGTAADRAKNAKVESTSSLKDDVGSTALSYENSCHNSACADGNHENPQTSIHWGINGLIKASLCIETDCEDQSCALMKGLVRHSRTCSMWESVVDVRAGERCRPCHDLLALCSHHASFCDDPECAVAYCQELRQRNRAFLELCDDKHSMG